MTTEKTITLTVGEILVLQMAAETLVGFGEIQAQQKFGIDKETCDQLWAASKKLGDVVTDPDLIAVMGNMGARLAAIPSPKAVN